MRLSALAALTLLAGCELEERHQPQGELFVTPKHQITYYGTAQDALGIDQAADMWLEWCSLRLIDPGASVAVLERSTVNVYPGERLPNGYCEWWHEDDWIDVARDADKGDQNMGLHHIGLLWLRHGWLHALYHDGGHAHFPYQ